MAPQVVTDQEFVLLCLKQLSTAGHKPDFAAIASEIGCTSNAAYHRHWRIMKNTPELASGAGPGASSPAASAPKTPVKRKKRTMAHSAVPENDQGNAGADGDGFLDDDADVNIPTPKKAKGAATKAARGKAKTTIASGIGKSKALATDAADDEDGLLKDDDATVDEDE